MNIRIPLCIAITAVCLAWMPGALQAQSTQHPDIPISKDIDPNSPAARFCMPFHYSGTVQFPPEFSGVTGHFDIPEGHALRVGQVSARLHQPGFRGADLGGWTHGHFSWYDMVLSNDQATYSAARDGAVYLDGSTPGKVTLYRRSAGVQGSGEFSVSGCLVNAIPSQLRKPDHSDDRLPPTRLNPGDALKTKQIKDSAIRRKQGR